MKKRTILIIIASVVIVLGAGFFWLNNRNRTLSPPGSASQTQGDLTVSVTYSRPSVRGRLIFGTEDQKALQPYGKYWRLGANESTEITFSKDVSFNGSAVKAGTYRMYAVPQADAFDIGLNSELGKWGYSEPDYSLDILHTKVPVQKTDSPVEQFTITTKPAEGGIDVVCEWSDTRIVIPVR